MSDHNLLFKDILKTEPVNQSKSLIELEVFNGESENVHQSSSFLNKDIFLKNLFNSLENDSSQKTRLNKFLLESQELPKNTSAQISDRVILKGWKNIENISARLIEISEEKVVLECLIDKENSLYEERSFRISLFENYKLEIGNLFYLRFFERPNEMKMEVHDDPYLSLKDDFPKLDFSVFKKSKLFKGK